VKLPNCENAIVPESKITRYLLSLTHPDGSSKAKFFIQFGFTVERWEQLALALLNHAADHPVNKVAPSPLGIRYIIEGSLSTPSGKTAMVRSVWFIGDNEDKPRLATAYPLPKRGEPNDSRA
jgi:hypothetical protein